MHSLVRQLRQVPLLPRAARTFRNAYARLVDSRLGIHTLPQGPPVRAPGTQNQDSLEYEALDYPVLQRLFDQLELDADDVVYDVGCGKGRIVCMAAQRGVRRCVGIEFDPELAKDARRNADGLRQPKSPIEIQTADAAIADYSDGTVYCLFNPFGRQTVLAMLQRIRESLERQPRSVRFGYGNAAHGYAMDECGWLEPAGSISSVWYRYPIRFWRSSREVEHRRARTPHAVISISDQSAAY
jgi:SAM-dependent methyltransferase